MLKMRRKRMVNFLAIGLMLVGTLIVSFGALMIKKGANRFSLREMIFSLYFWIGLSLYVLSTFFYILALRMEELSFVYPFASVSFIWITILSVKFLGEKMNKWKWYGLIGIIIGIVLIGIGS